MTGQITVFANQVIDKVNSLRQSGVVSDCVSLDSDLKSATSMSWLFDPKKNGCRA